MSRIPVVAVTMGDPAGIGPEIIAKAFAHSELYKYCRPFVVGNIALLRKAAQITGTDKQLKFKCIHSFAEAKFMPGTVDVIEHKNVDMSKHEFGKATAAGGKASYQYIETATKLALRGMAEAVVTCPINKEAIRKAGVMYAGHTEIIAHLTGASSVAMILCDGDLRVIHVSTHTSLRNACDAVKKQRVLEVIKLADKACRDFGIAEPRIGVAALNPHGGENGLFGDEEINEIIPAIEAAEALGINAKGPFPADTIFSKAAGGEFDMAVAMYHDQGHIPVKLLGFRWHDGNFTGMSGINITAGLPIIRTSVDHGTAYEIAGKGTALPDSLISAIDYATKLARSW